VRKHFCSKCHLEVPVSGGYCRKCANEYMRKVGKQGKFRHDSSEYKKVRVGKKVIGKHRVVAGVTNPKLYVHHKDHDPGNNDFENLEVLKPTEHYAVHHS